MLAFAAQSIAAVSGVAATMVDVLHVKAMRHYAEDISYYHRKVREVSPYSTAKELGSHCSLETARLAVEARKCGLKRVVAFDLAGPEANFPPSHHTQAFYEVINVLMSATVHAGEGYGPKPWRRVWKNC